MWWTGLELLVPFEPRVKPAITLESLPNEEERSVSLTTLALVSLTDYFLDRFSSLDKICRILAYCIRFLDGLRAKPSYATLAVDQIELHATLLFLVKLVQSEHFGENIEQLRKGKRLPKHLLKLAPCLDPKGVLRMGGRLVHSVLAFEDKHPALLPNKHRLTDLIIEHNHRIHLHRGRRAMQYLLAQRFWILGIHRAIKRVLSGCYRCFRVNRRAVQPPMADLSAERVNQVKPFSVTGVDFTGPFLMTNRRVRGTSSFKVYVCLFVCFAIKAIHLEIAFSFD